ncbi:MAG: rhomboid family intramembrane serine protease [Flavobacteriales bacterium]
MKRKSFSWSINAVLIGLHLGFFILAMILKYALETSAEDQWIHLLCAPRDFDQLLQQPWSSITHLFLHLHPLHLLFNLGILTLLLSPLVWHIGTKQVCIAFFAGGLSGYLAFCMVPAIGPSSVQYITGSSAALTSLICAGWVTHPQLKIKCYLEAIQRSDLLIDIATYLLCAEGPIPPSDSVYIGRLTTTV